MSLSLELRTMLGRQQVAIVGDHEGARLVIKGVLSALGVYDVAFGHTWEDAVMIHYRHRQDVLFMEIAAKGASLGAATAIRQALPTPLDAVPIIGYSSTPTQNLIEQARDCGIDEMVAVPVSPRAIQSRLVAVLTRRRAYVRHDSYRGPDRRRADRPIVGRDRRGR